MTKRLTSPERLLLLLLLLLQSFHIAILQASEPYCNETLPLYGNKSVVKTRTVVKKPKGIMKLFKSDKTVSEEYEVEEKYIEDWQVVVKCCDGYQMTPQKTCEHVCANGCPTHANCVGPNRCQCTEGYVSAVSQQNGSHYCESICGDDCEPQCEPGYAFDKKYRLCRPQCTTGDGCRNGHCTAPQECACLPSYYMNEATSTCESRCGLGYVWQVAANECVLRDGDYVNVNVTTPENWNEEMMGDREIAFDSKQQFPPKPELDIFMDPETDEATTDLTSDTSENSTVLDSSTETPCQDGYVYFRGDCRPEIFPSDEYDCHYKPCLPHASCLQNGSCACHPGYVWKRDPLHCGIPDKLINTAKNSYLWVIILIAVSSTATVSLLLFLILKFLQRKRGQLNGEVARSDLHCEYDKDNAVEGKIAVL